MKRAVLLKHAMAKPGAWQDTPWEDDLVVKVGEKIFLFVGGPGSTGISVSCGAEAEEWRARYPDAITPAPYLARHGWNRVELDAGVPDDELRELVDASYDIVVAKLPKSKRP
jgi:predicted DNA-binding protein (MmcQ/YjbR family)